MNSDDLRPKTLPEDKITEANTEKLNEQNQSPPARNKTTGSGPGSENVINEPLAVLNGKKILLTVTGGVAAYKAAGLAHLMTKAGAQVRVIITEAGERFVTALTFSALTGHSVATDMWTRSGTMETVPHVAWAEWADLLITAPASADFLAKLAHGLAGDLASAVALAYRGPRLIAPAMNTGMYLNQATVANLDILRSRDYKVLESPVGLLACGTSGPGRMAEPEVIAYEAARLLSGGALKNKKVLVTGGATQESWDDIRFLSNRSSGRMGLALAKSAWIMGAQVTYLAGPTAATLEHDLSELTVKKVESTGELLLEVKNNLLGAWALVMNAAPADFTPAEKIIGKINKSESKITSLALKRTPDILKEVSPIKGNCLVVGFAAEEKDLIERAKEKLQSKNLDYIAANQAGGPDSAFGTDSIKLTLISSKQNMIEIGPGSKFQASWDLWQALAEGWN
ncbi:MAG: bifunctional phosphopantothenoylcysteine decarboxylase/phosphopantothenate--cysteine ligase CoaBC [Deltaproteobacteria bacterium]|jgi:phosphopantothenoylcysteine decarboxylase/phosphopantothenate--cysteine ligase|nr:bifunctional phosphopantothenoylcysteine decarboxylase/phosphopantothenate--cysteine ligase CoaBC [Deltaproteobacteria bacterium]